MISSLFAGTSGLNAQSNAMAVIGDNIANVNTTAFKGSNISFASILSSSSSAFSGNEIGRGVALSSVNASMSQGSLQTTTSATDLAIVGQGFFMVKDNENTPFYTRAGQFKFDKDGNMIDNNKMAVQGWDLSSTAGTGGPLANITIPNGGTTDANPTSEVSIQCNLDNTAAVGDTYSSSMTVYDSLGNDVPMTHTFTRTAAGWDWAPSIPATAGTVAGGGSLAFDANGALTNIADETITLTLLSGATTPQAITWDLVDASNVTNGDVTGYAADSSTTFHKQDGYASGSLQGINISDAGMITGVFSNGQTKPLFQLATATFQSDWGLAKRGKNLYSETLDSGQPMIGIAGTGVNGAINSNSLEMSNVDLAAEFVNLITTQRAFQANSRVITASDEILMELINIKR